MLHFRFARLTALLAVALTTAALAAGQFNYPKSKRVEQVDEYHGTKVSDPYRWLEDDARTSDEVRNWVTAENDVTNSYLASIPERDAIKKTLKSLWDYEKYTAPSKVADRYFFAKNDGLQNQFVVYMLDSLKGEPKVLFDPNTWSTDGTVALGGTSYSDDARFCAYSIQEAGSDWQRIKIRDIDGETDLPETLEWIKFSGAAWTNDGKGFFYSRFDAPAPNKDAGNGEEEGKAKSKFHAVNKFQKFYYHRLNTPQSADVLVYHRPDQSDWQFGPSVTEDGRYLVITVSKGTDDKYRIMYRDLAEPYGLPVELIDNFDAEYSLIGNDGAVFYFKTDLNAPKGKVIAIDTRKPSMDNWREIIPESENTLQNVNLLANMFVASYLKDAVTQVRMFDMAGAHVRDVQFPGIGSAGGFGGKRTDTETFFSFSSFTTPPSIYRYDMITGQSSLMRQAKVEFDQNAYETKQVFYTSKDGTKIPMFITARKDVKLDGSNTTLLYGYGGFNISMLPQFSISRLGWLEMGGIYAVANLRGGGEYGEAWHKAGTKTTKQNVFDDFIAAAEHLISSKYTRSDKLAILGGSNGGLLVGACMTQRPDLYGACLPAVGVMDMLRFHKFTIGYAWADDYGRSDDPEHPEWFKALYAYSPYHNLRENVKYPPTMVTTADTDDRVVPGHSFKFAAALQHAQEASGGEAPVLIRIETKAGHGAGKPTEKVIEEVADQYAFLLRNLAMELPSRFR